MSLKLIDPMKDDRWDQFVHRHPSGSVYHLSAWMRVISSAYGYLPFCVVLETAGRITGGVPFMRVDSALTGKRLVSLPFTSYCPLLIDSHQLRRAIEFAWRFHSDVSYVETRSLSDQVGTMEGVRGESHHYTHILDLRRPLENLLASFHSSTGRSIRKAERNHLELRLGSRERDLEAFYTMEVRVRKRLGLPPQPYRFFAETWNLLKPKALVFLPMVAYRGRNIAAAVMLKFKNSVHYEYAASDEDYLQLRPNHHLIWATIKMAHNEGFHCYDFGRTAASHSTLLMFKDRWAAQRRALTYSWCPETQSRASDGRWRAILTRLNKFLPPMMLRLQGEILYSHLG